MNKFFMALGITVMVGILIFIGIDYFKDSDSTTVDDVVEDEVDVDTTFDVSYAIEIPINEVEDLISSSDVFLLFIGIADDENTIVASSILSEIDEEYNLDIYYLEKTDEVVNSEEYASLLDNYEEASSYLGFTPVLLVFRDSTFVAAYPGFSEYDRVENFLEYSEIIDAVE